MPVAASGKPLGGQRPDDDHATAGAADALHLRKAGVAAVGGRGRERRAHDDHVGRVIGDRQIVEEAVDHARAAPVFRLRELAFEDLAERRHGFDRH